MILKDIVTCATLSAHIAKGIVTKASLDKMLLTEVAFQRAAVDLVGPIEPRTTYGNRHILTLVDFATRYKEAVALSSSSRGSYGHVLSHRCS